MGNRCYVLYTPYPEPLSCKHSDGGLRPRSGGSGHMASRCSHSDVKRSYPLVLRNLCSCRSSLHSRVRGALQPIRFDVLAPSTTGNCFRSSEVGDMDMRIVERGVDVGYAPSILGLRLIGHGLGGLSSRRALEREFKLFRDRKLLDPFKPKT